MYVAYVLIAASFPYKASLAASIRGKGLGPQAPLKSSLSMVQNIIPPRDSSFTKWDFSRTMAWNEWMNEWMNKWNNEWMKQWMNEIMK